MFDDVAVSNLGSSVWSDRRNGTDTLAVPVGSVEQHGPHLPLDTDTTIAVAVAAQLTGTVLAPAIAYGASGEHEDFPGTVSIGAAALESVLIEYGRSSCRWAARVLFVNGHGGNAQSIANAVRQLRFEARDVVWLPCAVPGGDAHAGRTETSLLLHIAPDRVRLHRAEPGNTDPMAQLLPTLRAEGVRACSPNGVLGDPTGANAHEGEQLLAAMVVRSNSAVARWKPDSNGMLT